MPLFSGLKVKFSLGLKAIGLTNSFLLTKDTLSLLILTIKSSFSKFSKTLSS